MDCSACRCYASVRRSREDHYQAQLRAQTSSLQTHLPQIQTQTRTICISGSLEHAYRIQGLPLCRSLNIIQFQPVLDLDVVKKRPFSALNIDFQPYFNHVLPLAKADIALAKANLALAKANIALAGASTARDGQSQASEHPLLLSRRPFSSPYSSC